MARKRKRGLASAGESQLMKRFKNNHALLGAGVRDHINIGVVGQSHKKHYSAR